MILGFSCAVLQKVFVESTLSVLISTLFGGRDDEAFVGGLVAALEPVCVVRCFFNKISR